MRGKQFKIELLINECKKLYDEHGISVLLYKNFDKKLYFRLYQKGIRLSDVRKILGVEKEFSEYKQNTSYMYKGEERHYWSWSRIIKIVKPIVKKHNFLPPAAWFQENRYQSLIQAVYNLGKSWENLRDEFKSYESSSFVTSRNGMRWRSHPEASFSNFLYNRGIEHQKGRKYPDDFSKITGQTYGYYDLMFKDKNNNFIDVEIWGEKPRGHAQKHYAYKKHLKEKYNLNNKNCLGINFREGVNEKRLVKI